MWSPIAEESVERPCSEATRSRVKTDGLSSLKPIRVLADREANSSGSIDRGTCINRGFRAKALSNLSYCPLNSSVIACRLHVGDGAVRLRALERVSEA